MAVVSEHVSTVALVLAIYGSVVASGGLAWQIYTYRRNERVRREAERTKLDVYVRPAIYGYQGQRGAGVRFINLSTHKVRVDSVTFIHQDREGYDIWSFAFLHGTLPQYVEPRDAGELLFDLEKLESGDEPIDPYRPVVARVTLSTGESFLSEPTTLLSR